MPINEIEIAGSSLSLKVFNCEIDDANQLFKTIMEEGDQFNIESELPGFHDYETDGEIIRGFYSGIVPFEVEHLIDGNSTKTLFKRIESCEFIATRDFIFATGKPGPMKGLSHSISALSGAHVSQIEFEFNQMNQLQEKMTQLKAVALINPRDREVRKAKLSGNIDSYTDYNVIDPRNHGIESVKGIIDTSLGPLNATVGRKGSLRLGVRKGFVMTVDCLSWIMNLVINEKS